VHLCHSYLFPLVGLSCLSVCWLLSSSICFPFIFSISGLSLASNQLVMKGFSRINTNTTTTKHPCTRFAYHERVFLGFQRNQDLKTLHSQQFLYQCYRCFSCLSSLRSVFFSFMFFDDFTFQ